MVGHQQQVTYATVWGRDRVSQSLGDVPKWVGHWLELRCAARPWRNWPSREQPMSLRHQPVGETFRRISPDVLVSALPSTIAASPKGSETQQACVSVTAPLRSTGCVALGDHFPLFPLQFPHWEKTGLRTHDFHGHCGLALEEAVHLTFLAEYLLPYCYMSTPSPVSSSLVREAFQNEQG